MDTAVFSLYQTTLERIRIVAAAQALLLERGLAAVELSDVAISLRIPIAAVERQFPAGKSALVQASLEAHLRDIHARLLAQRHECSTAVEELLAMRRLLAEQISDARSLFVQELATLYPSLGYDMQHLRTTFTPGYLVENLRRGIREGYYQSDLRVQEQAQGWLHQADVLMQAAHTNIELVESLHALFDCYLLNITTTLGAFVIRRMQENPPYYD